MRSRLRSLWRNLFRRRRVEHVLDEELRACLDILVRQKMAAGATQAEARRRALIELGGLEQVKEEVRHVRVGTFVESVWQDVRYAVRALWKSPSFTTAAVLTIALGIGANTAMFTVVHTLLFEPLPYRDSEQLVRLVSNVPPPATSPTGQPTRLKGQISVGELLELRARAKTVSHVGVYVNDFKTMTGTDSTARLEGWRVEPVLFRMLGTPPLLGRVLTQDDATSGTDNVVLLSYETWQAQFDSDRNVVGRSVELDGVRYSVAGVMPPTFRFPFEAANRQFWVPLALTTEGDEYLKVRLPMLARLGDGVPMQAAVAELNAVLHETTRSGATYELERMRDELVEPVKRAVVVLMAAAGFVLLIACVNVGNLLVARSGAREREIAIRAALGASRGRLMRHLLAESMFLALVGAVAGVALAFGAISLLRPLATTLSRADVGTFTSFPRLDEVAIDGPVLAFTLIITTVTGILFGLAPGVRLSDQSRMDRLRQGTTTTRSPFGVRHRHGTRALLVVAEIASAMVLLVGGSLLIRSFVRLATVPLGYDPSHVLTFQVAMPEGRYRGSQIQTFAEDLVARLQEAPGVQSAAYAPLLPVVKLLRHTAGFRRTPGRPTTAPLPREDFRGVSRDYFRVMGVHVVAGRGFNENDRAGQPRVVVINRALARRDFGSENPIGQTAYLEPVAEPWQIVGVVEDVRQVGPDQDPAPQVFVDSRQWPGMAPGLRLLQYYAIRTSADPMSVVPHVRDVLRQVDPQAGLYNIAPMERIVSNSVSRPRLYAVLSGIFSAVAVALAAIGIYGVIAYFVAQRTHEIGIRVALGARRSQIMGLVLGQSLALTAVGLTLGLAGAGVLTRYLQGLLFGLTPLDPVTFAAASLWFALVAGLASYLPARRATKVDPMIALRAE